ncbi:unnamed protein product [Pleuronectes platessa]|uniref:Uncharacterized protein n=1 Tax=Pleuronectes platessa TaxID=8262 RepID=A0A9N7VBD1_PLEPL|nr:unnamed protein product [Pleuronectes platessa]
MRGTKGEEVKGGGSRENRELTLLITASLSIISRLTLLHPSILSPLHLRCERAHDRGLHGSSWFSRRSSLITSFCPEQDPGRFII